MHPEYEAILDDFGRVTSRAPVDPVDLAALSAIFPKDYVDFLGEAGTVMWDHGRFQTVNPLQWTGVTKALFDNDPDFEPDQTWLLGYSALGILSFWNAPSNTSIKIDLPRLDAVIIRSKIDKANKEIGLLAAFPDVTQNVYDIIHPTTLNYVLASTLKKVKGLGHGDVLGFFPALALGGSGAPESVQKVRAFEHFALLAGMGPVELYVSSGGKRQLSRNLGAQ